MALSGKLERTMELKSPPEKFYNVWKREAHQIPDHTPTNIQAVKVHEGEWDTHGSIKIWNYTLEGKPEVVKEMVEHDDTTLTITMHSLEGDVMKLYKVFRGKWQLTPKGTGTLANLIVEYEKQDPTIPPPHNYFDFMISITKEIDEGLVKASNA